MMTKNASCRWLNCLLAGVLACGGVAAAPQRPQSLPALVEAAYQEEGRYRPADAGELDLAEVLFVRTLSLRGPQDLGELTTAWADAGFDLRGVGPGLFALVEQPGQRVGRGLYAFRIGGNGPVLQAPHQRDDWHTGRLAAQLMVAGRFAAAAFNTVPRKRADLAHRTDSWFIAFSRAVAQVHPQRTVLQIHGFDTDKRSSAAGESAAMIVSNGTREPGRAATALCDCSTRRLGLQARLFPRDVRELGALTNTVGAALRTAGHRHFVHVELSEHLREHLRRDGGARARWMRCLTDPAP